MGQQSELLSYRWNNIFLFLYPSSGYIFNYFADKVSSLLDNILHQKLNKITRFNYETKCDEHNLPKYNIHKLY